MKDDDGNGDDNDKQNVDGNKGTNSNDDEHNTANAITTNEILASNANTSSPSSNQNKGLVSLYYVIIIFNINNYSKSE